jgi:hypothetical protein
MDEKTSRLMSQLKDRLIEISDGQITEIINEARDEALAEAKAMIKGMMVQTILEHALRELEGAENMVVPARETVAPAAAMGVVPANETPSPTAQAQPNTTLRHAQDVAESEERIRQEIEAIRRKIAENERLLSQVKASPVQTEEVQAPPAEPVLSPAPSVAERDEVSAPGEGREEGCGYYVYGIVEGDSSQPVEGLPEEGIDPAYPVYALPYQGIQAVVSRVSLQEFGQERLEANLNDIKWVEAKVCAHQGVLEAVLARRTLIPMKFCTIYRSEERVQEMLAQYHADLANTLSRLAGKQEWGVKVYFDREALAQKVDEISDKVKALKSKMATKSSGAAYFLKKKLEETIAEEIERLSDEAAQRSHDLLSSQADASTINSLQSKEITGRKEEMLLNGVYLVAEDTLAAFRIQLADLEKEYGDLGFHYEMTGPWPPYNFATIGLKEDATHE